MLFVSAGLFGTFLFLTYYLQQTLGYSPLVTGVAFLPLSGASVEFADAGALCRYLAQRTFPREGFTLYDSDDLVAAVLEQAGFTRPEVRIFGAADRPMGRLALSAPAPRQEAADTADTAGRAQKG
jgi:hypothetical protein